MKHPFLLSIGLVAALSASSQAATVITPIDASATASLRSSSPISATIDGTGLVNTTGDISTWTHAVNDPQGNYWLNNRASSDTITFDLGG
ncbi:MAG: hypothetical protein KJO79_07265, partial [Verrucomicrobiae bacterium]|nr:hypothetical protein [Verrucomicrobiae bacterium]